METRGAGFASPDRVGAKHDSFSMAATYNSRFLQFLHNGLFLSDVYKEHLRHGLAMSSSLRVVAGGKGWDNAGPLFQPVKVTDGSFDIVRLV
jgi:hypothetical protein